MCEPSFPLKLRTQPWTPPSVTSIGGTPRGSKKVARVEPVVTLVYDSDIDGNLHVDTVGTPTTMAAVVRCPYPVGSANRQTNAEIFKSMIINKDYHLMIMSKRDGTPAFPIFTGKTPASAYVPLPLPLPFGFLTRVIRFARRIQADGGAAGETDSPR